ncbi:MAG: lipid kinase [Candidatus Competibacteraceae bacterium]
MALQRALLIINQQSRSGNADVTAATERLERQGFMLVTAVATTPAAITESILQHRHAIDLVIIGGGDGTLNAAAPALVQTGLPLGILPTGTANDLARTLQIPAVLEQASEIIIHGKRHSIDLGWVNGHYFFNVAHIGLGVKVTHALSSGIKRRWGALSYARAVVDALRTNRPFRVTIECDGSTLRTRAMQVAVGNGRHYGGGMTIMEDATIDDQQLDLYCLNAARWWQLLAAALAVRTGRWQQQPHVHVLRGREISIRTRRSLTVSADGELMTRTPAFFRVIPQAISVFVPPDYPAPPSAGTARPR